MVPSDSGRSGVLRALDQMGAQASPEIQVEKGACLSSQLAGDRKGGEGRRALEV